MTVHLHLVPSPADALHLVREDLGYVCEQSDGELTLGDAVQIVMQKDADLWLILEDGKYSGCFVTEIVSGGRICNVAMARVKPGSKAFPRAIELLGEWAHEFGARLSATSRRPGMGRLLARLGWKPRFIEYIEPVPEDQCTKSTAV